MSCAPLKRQKFLVAIPDASKVCGWDFSTCYHDPGMDRFIYDGWSREERVPAGWVPLPNGEAR